MSGDDPVEMISVSVEVRMLRLLHWLNFNLYSRPCLEKHLNYPVLHYQQTDIASIILSRVWLAVP